MVLAQTTFFDNLAYFIFDTAYLEKEAFLLEYFIGQKNN